VRDARSGGPREGGVSQRRQGRALEVVDRAGEGGLPPAEAAGARAGAGRSRPRWAPQLNPNRVFLASIGWRVKVQNSLLAVSKKWHNGSSSRTARSARYSSAWFWSTGYSKIRLTISMYLPWAVSPLSAYCSTSTATASSLLCCLSSFPLLGSWPVGRLRVCFLLGIELYWSSHRSFRAGQRK
jgi:hypothetical protein